MVFDDRFSVPKGITKQNTMENDNLNNGLDGLLDMFKKLIEGQDLDSIPGINEEQKEQLKLFLEDFDELKKDMKIEIHKLDPFTKQMAPSTKRNSWTKYLAPRKTWKPIWPPSTISCDSLGFLTRRLIVCLMSVLL